MARAGRWGIRFLALPAALALAGVAAPAAGQDAKLPPGVSIAGLPVGGFTSEEARTLVRRALAEPVPFRLGGRSWAASPEQLGVAAAVDDAIAAALRAPLGAAIEVEAEPAAAALRKYVGLLDSRLSREPEDARLLRLDGKLRPVLAREVAGRKLDRRATAAAIADAVRTAQREPIRPVFEVARASVTRKNFGPIIVIRRGSKTLSVYERGRLINRFGVATGQAKYPTPLGTFAIVDMQMHPWWYPPDSDWARGLKPVPPGPGNPLGTRWMGLSAWGVGIHGTPDAASIGYSASHGCIRMRIADAEWLFQRVRIGTPVVIVGA